jgi:hypothetical protein
LFEGLYQSELANRYHALEFPGNRVERERPLYGRDNRLRCSRDSTDVYSRNRTPNLLPDSLHPTDMSSKEIKTDANQNASTADYRKYPKGPDFKLIVLLFCLTIVACLVVGWLLLRTNPRLVPDAHGPRPPQGSTHASPQ